MRTPLREFNGDPSSRSPVVDAGRLVVIGRVLEGRGEVFSGGVVVNSCDGVTVDVAVKDMDEDDMEIMSEVSLNVAADGVITEVGLNDSSLSTKYENK